MYVGLMILGRRKCTAEPLVPEPSAFVFELGFEKKKVTNYQVLNKFQQN
jgi:hypothetical protein